MNVNEMAKRLTEELGESAAPRTVLRKAGEIAKEALREGKSVDMLGLLRVQLTEQALEGKSKGPLAVRAIPMTGLLPTSVSTKDLMRDAVVVLAVQTNDPFSKVMGRKLSHAGRKVIVAEGAEEVMAAITENAVDVILMDSTIEMSDDIRLWLKSDPARSLISLIALYPAEVDPNQIETLRICEDEILSEPYEIDQLSGVIDSEILRVGQERKYFRHETSFQFPAKGIYQQQAADLLERFASTSGLSEEGQMGLVVAFREAVDNAIRHGNKAKESSIVTVAYVLDHEKVTVTVEDEGPGFDSGIYVETRVSGDAVKTARARHKEGRRGGLGIMLMLKSVDRLEYNRSGNIAKLTKFLVPADKKGTAAASPAS